MIHKKILIFLLVTTFSCGVQVDRNTTRIAQSTEILENQSQELVILFKEFVDVFSELNMSIKDVSTMKELIPDLSYFLSEAKQYLEDAKKKEEGQRSPDEKVPVIYQGDE